MQLQINIHVGSLSPFGITAINVVYVTYKTDATGTQMSVAKNAICTQGVNGREMQRKPLRHPHLKILFAPGL